IRNPRRDLVVAARRTVLHPCRHLRFRERRLQDHHLQAATPDHLRGRLQGVFIVVVAGGPRLGDMLAGGGTKLLSEGWVLLVGGLACVAVAWTLAHLQSGFLTYDARNPVP
ncbi:major facilitator superfamily protein, partial [Arthrobacter sp. Hiyo6]